MTELKHDAEYICTCERWKEVEFIPTQELIRCRDCKYAYMTTKTSFKEPEVKYCDLWFPDEAMYMDANYYCASAERKEE